MICAVLAMAQTLWAKDLPSALAQAGPERMVMAHFWRSDCPWCDKLEAETYKSPGFSELARDAVPVKVDGEVHGASLVERYLVRGYPTILFLSGDGETLGRLQGYVSIDALRFEGLAAAKRRKSLRGADVSGAVARVEAYAARRDEPKMAAALEDARKFTGAWPAEAALAAGVFFEEEIRTPEASEWFLRAWSAAQSPRVKAYAAMGWARTRLSGSHFSEAAKGFRAALDTGALFESHRELAEQLLKMCRERGAAGS